MFVSPPAAAALVFLFFVCEDSVKHGETDRGMEGGSERERARGHTEREHTERESTERESTDRERARERECVCVC